jgi:hypothetical protein
MARVREQNETVQLRVPRSVRRRLVDAMVVTALSMSGTAVYLLYQVLEIWLIGSTGD